MKRSICLLTVILLGLVPANAVQENRLKPDAPTDATFIANERALHDAVAKADKAAFLALVVPDGVWTTQQGFVPMNLLANGLDAFQLRKADIVNPRVTRLGDDSTILLYAWTVTGTFGDQPLPRTMLSATVWVRRNGKWLAVHHQDTELKTN
jgi:uncharacterized protein (TIGR02246 family)